MGVLSHINGVAAANISHVNGVAKASIANVNEQTFPSTDSVSLNPTFLNYDEGGSPYLNDYTYVTASGAWTASIISDPDGMIQSYTTGGSGSGNLYVDVFFNDGYDNSSIATIRVTVGTAYADLTICRDGFVELCE